MDRLLARQSDACVLRDHFAATGQISIRDFLSHEFAHALADELSQTRDWVEIFRAGGTVYEMPSADYIALAADRKDRLRVMIEAAAKTGLQYRYRAIRIAEDGPTRAARGSMRDQFADLLNSPEALDFLRFVTGRLDIAFVDAQATDYQAGDFLTTHDDDVAGKHRAAAYVFGLTQSWQADWGGLLLFEQGEAVSGFVPDFNVLRLFAVPANHHVSYVAPWVDARRLSITGWLRTQMPAD